MCGTVWICAYLLILTATITEQQQCGVANLPAFGDRQDDENSLGRPPVDKLQAIVPAYTFNCTGRVTEWRACVEQGGGRERYYIQFQVWRPTAVAGCYRLVGYNAPPLTIGGDGRATNADQLLQPGPGGDPLHRCVVLSVNESEQIEFQPGDVIGYYADRFRDDGEDPDDGGVQVISDPDVVVYHRISVPLSELQTQYAIPALGPDPSSCGFEFVESGSNLFQMTSSTSGAPIVSLNLVTTVVSSGIQSSSILFSTAILPTLKPTSTLTTTPSVSPFGAHSSSSASVISSSPCSGGCGDSKHSLNSLPVVVGVAGALLVLITAVIITITVLVCLRRRNKGPDLVDNVAYISGTREESRNENMMHSEGGIHILTSTNEAYGTAKLNNGATDVSTSTNPAYQATQSQKNRDSFLYDYLN